MEGEKNAPIHVEREGCCDMKRYGFSPDEFSCLENLRTPLAVFQFLDKRATVRVLSAGFCDLFGFAGRKEAYEVMESDMYSTAHPDDAARVADAAYRFSTEDVKFEVVYRVKQWHGSSYKIIHAIGEHIFKDTGERLAYVWYTDEGNYTGEQDLHETQLNSSFRSALREESMLQTSHYDRLTGLPNMSYFFELVEAGRDSLRKAGRTPAVLFIDLNGMKYFNQRFGFSEGDKLLQEVSKVLTKHFKSENCSRFGQDHFAVFTGSDGLEDKFRSVFEDCAGVREGLSARIGICLEGTEPEDVSTVCDRAKYACDSLRGTYVSAFAYFDEEMLSGMRNRQYIIDHLDQALAERWVQVHYQPIVRAVNGRVCDEEALSRWVDPVKGMLSPAQFIPVLEDARLIYKLDLYVLDRVLEKIRFQKESGLTVVPHSINLSRSDFDVCDIVEEIRRRVDAAGVSRDRLTIEITESVIGSNFDFMKEQVSRFRSLGFPVWMDDFGSGYSSLDVLQSIEFDLIKFDMSFMKKLNEGDSGRIILTELMKMATALGVDTVCEGVETEKQARFLQEIGCSKLQGFYYCKAIPFEAIVERYEKGVQIGYENPEESEYYEAIGRVNLYDLAVIANEDENAFQNFFNSLPMCIMEFQDGFAQYVRSNQSYRDFMKRFFNYDMSGGGVEFADSPHVFGMTFINTIKKCCRTGNRAFFDEQMSDGSMVHSFIRRIGQNPVTGKVAVAIAVLSVTPPDEGTTYADIARALAADYYNIYYINMETERFVEYSSRVGEEEMAMERHGTNFFESARRDTLTRIYEEDQEQFLAVFTKENISRELDEQGVFTTTYRLMDTGTPMYVNMKITRMPSGNHIIMGISIIDMQMKQKELLERTRKERDTLARVMALSEDFLSLYTIEPDTGRYVEYNATKEYESLGFDKEGEDFFCRGIIDGKKTICPEDLPEYLRMFTKETILREIRENGVFKLQYRLMINGEPRPVSLRIAPFREGDEEKLVAGVRAWKVRK